MKRTLFTALAAIAALFMVGCNSSTVGTAQESAGGAPYELIAVVGQPQWEGEVGSLLQEMCATPVPYLNEVEPRLDLMRVLPSAFKGFIKVHRNVLYLNVDASLEDISAIAEESKYADGQMIIYVSAPNDELLIEYLKSHKEELLGAFELAERNRALKMNKRYKEGVMVDRIEEMFGFRIDIPRGYSPRGTSGDSLLVTSFEYPIATQGIAVYSYPYTGEENFKAENLIAQRDNFVKNIPGPSGKSYMTTVKDFYPPEVTYKRINGRLWAEMRGFWNLEGGDFMGGPMLSWSTLDAENNKVITIDCYVFSPKHGQRDLVRGMEHLIYSVKFPQKEKEE